MKNYTSEDKEFVRRFKSLLNIFDGKEQLDNGYFGHPRPLTEEDVARHLLGNKTFGFCVSTEHFQSKLVWARFAGIDIDKDFDKVLPIFRHALEEACLGAQCFITDGSAPGKGKVIILLQEGIERYRAASLLRQLFKRAHVTAPHVIPEEPKNGTIKLFPCKSIQRALESQVLRVGGRNTSKKGPLETFSTLAGGPLDWTVIERCSGNKVRAATRRLRGRLHLGYPSWLRDALRDGLRWSDFPTGTGGIRTFLARLAFYCRKYYRCGESAEKYRELLQALIANSPDLGNPSPKHGDTRNPLARELEMLGAWEFAISYPIWQPAVVPARSKSSARAYEALVAVATSRNLREHCFAVDQETIADVMGSNKSAAQKALLRAAEDGFIVRLHSGVQYKPGSRGAPGMYGLVGAGETLSDVWLEARKDGLLRERYAKLPVFGVADPFLLPCIPTPKFWAIVHDNPERVLRFTEPWALQCAEQIVKDEFKVQCEAFATC